MDYMDQLILFIISLLANIFSAFAGGGAGLLQFPALIFLGLPFGVALATHKIASVALGLGATIRNLREEPLERKLALCILASGLPGVVLGANIILNVPSRHAEIALGLLTIGLGVYSLLRAELGQQSQPRHRDTIGYLTGGGALFFIGILNGSLTSGTGLFVTLWLIHWYGLDYRRAIAYTLILVGLFWNGSGAIALGILGEIAWDWLPTLLIGSFLGGYIGAHLAIIKGNKLIKRVFELVTLLIGIKLLVG